MNPSASQNSYFSTERPRSGFTLWLHMGVRELWRTTLHDLHNKTVLLAFVVLILIPFDALPPFYAGWIEFLDSLVHFNPHFDPHSSPGYFFGIVLGLVLIGLSFWRRSIFGSFSNVSLYEITLPLKTHERMRIQYCLGLLCHTPALIMIWICQWVTLLDPTIHLSGVGRIFELFLFLILSGAATGGIVLIGYFLKTRPSGAFSNQIFLRYFRNLSRNLSRTLNRGLLKSPLGLEPTTQTQNVNIGCKSRELRCRMKNPLELAVLAPRGFFILPPRSRLFRSIFPIPGLRGGLLWVKFLITRLLCQNQIRISLTGAFSTLIFSIFYTKDPAELQADGLPLMVILFGLLSILLFWMIQPLLAEREIHRSFLKTLPAYGVVHETGEFLVSALFLVPSVLIADGALIRSGVHLGPILLTFFLICILHITSFFIFRVVPRFHLFISMNLTLLCALGFNLLGAQ